jgi:hypothetical protein
MRTTDVPTVPAEEAAMSISRLLGHLLSEHGRTPPELAGLPLADLHRFEHVEHELGLIPLSHRHGADGARRPLDSDEHRTNSSVTDRVAP